MAADPGHTYRTAGSDYSCTYRVYIPVHTSNYHKKLGNPFVWWSLGLYTIVKAKWYSTNMEVWYKVLCWEGVNSWFKIDLYDTVLNIVNNNILLVTPNHMDQRLEVLFWGFIYNLQNIYNTLRNIKLHVHINKETYIYKQKCHQFLWTQWLSHDP